MTLSRLEYGLLLLTILAKLLLSATKVFGDVALFYDLGLQIAAVGRDLALTDEQFNRQMLVNDPRLGSQSFFLLINHFLLLRSLTSIGVWTCALRCRRRQIR